MKPVQKYILQLIFLDILFLGTGLLPISIIGLKLIFSDLAILSSVFLVNSIIVLIIFFKGQTKEPDSQTLHSLVSLSFKFLLELVLALVWFIVAKKTSFPSVLLFFVLYLTFTLFLIWVILKTLKDKSL